MDNALVERINKVAKTMRERRHPATDQVIPRLNYIRELVLSGTIPGPEEFRFIDFYDLTKSIPKCKWLSPLGECRIGVMEWCNHRGEWKNGLSTCKKYIERNEK